MVSDALPLFFQEDSRRVRAREQTEKATREGVSKTLKAPFSNFQTYNAKKSCSGDLLFEFMGWLDPKVSVQLLGLPLLQPQNLPSLVFPSNPFGTLPKVLLEMFQDMKKLKWVLANSFYELEKVVINFMVGICPITMVGPLVLPSLLGQDQSEDMGIEMWKPIELCMEWLKHRPSISAISMFGYVVK
ncbi:UDP-glycosyltransferase 84B2 [Spatholobus suberectus]|nr:UDP-glycosyltransferase 84B2 [Spatholobus suberectus]